MTCVLTVFVLLLSLAAVNGECHCRYQFDCVRFPSRPCSAKNTADNCATGWLGPYCQKQNVAQGKLSYQKMTCRWNSLLFSSSFAVDGRTTDRFSSRPYTCSCSKSIDTIPVPEWTVYLTDIGKEYIHQLRLYLESSKPERNRGMTIWVNDKICYNWSTSQQPHKLEDVVCHQPLVGNKVTITIPQSGKYLILCEVQVFICSDGWFGIDCDKQCNCQDKSEVCDKISGFCRSGCAAGFQGVSCQYACLDGYYGSYCNSRCGSCKYNSTCDKVTGNCQDGCQRNFKKPLCNVCSDGWFGDDCDKPCNCQKKWEVCDKISGVCRSGCAAGFTGDGCQYVCRDGWFGDQCDKQCHCQSKEDICDKEFGTCVSGCAAGFKGDNCQTQCVDGIFGPNCNETCGMCEGGYLCNKTTGKCPRGCVSGYIQDDVLCRTECVDGVFGPNCNETCGMCEGGYPCNKTTGRCPRGCVSGYIQDDVLCRTVSPKPTVQNSLLAAAGGGASAVLVVIIVLVVAVVVFTKRRKRENGENNTSSQMEEDMDHLQLNAINTGNTLPLFDEDEDAVFCVENDLYVSGEDMSTYYNWVPPHMTLDKLQQCVMDKKTRSTLETQLKAIPYGLRRPHDVGRKAKNKVKNRFVALYPYDHSRVVLEGVGDGYINASYITGFDDTPRYIATQGPTHVTFGDFWRMIWQERVTTVIMLTQFMEHKKKKCDMYWPKKAETKQYGMFTVTNKDMTVRADYTISKLVIHCPDSEERTVSHFHYTKWPDHGVPSVPALVTFWKKVKQHDEKTGPLVVHCSAGVGRTGTFIALDCLVDEYQSEHKVNVFMCVTKMREARMNMVQTLGQYQFVHDAVLEAIYSRDTNYTCPDLNTLFGTEGVNADQLDNKLKPQFKILETLRESLLDMNGDQAIIYENEAQVRRARPSALAVRGAVSSTILSSVVSSSMLLVTRTPLPDSMVDFWTLVTDYDCSTIVSLDVTKELRELYPDANKHIEYGSVIMKHIEEIDTPVYTQTRVVLTSKNQRGPPRYVTVFHLKSSDAMSRDTRSLLTIVKRVDEEICSTGHNVLVHCPDGYHDCGIFCAALNVIGQLRLDREVDIFMALRKLHCVQPHFVLAYEQYKLCYDLVREFICSASATMH